MSKIVLSGLIEGIRSNVDGSIKITIATNEMDSGTVGSVFSMRNKYVKCLLSDNNITEMEEKIINETQIRDERKIKSPAQRLRAVLYILFTQSGYTIDFEDYYKACIEEYIQAVKNKLDKE